MFLSGERVVYPGHGVAQINRILEKIVGGSVVSFYELKFLHKDMTILVPTSNATSIGIRPLSSHDIINDIFKLLAEPKIKTPAHEVNASNWNKRNKEYQNKLRSGNLHDISKIYHDLKCLEQYKELSFGEKTLLNQTEELLAQEIALVTDVGSEEKAVQQLRAFFHEMQHTKKPHSGYINMV